VSSIVSSSSKSNAEPIIPFLSMRSISTAYLAG
jgi:hypothetical protein